MSKKETLKPEIVEVVFLNEFKLSEFFLKEIDIYLSKKY